MQIARFRRGNDAPRFGVVDGDELVLLSGDPLMQGIVPLDHRVPKDDVVFLSPVIPRSKIVGIGRNYVGHVQEMGWSVDENPVMFFKPNTAVIGPDDTIVIPPGVTDVDPEGELAIVIGTLAKNVKAADADSVIFGYTICNDVSSRSLQHGDGQWARAKGFDTFCPIGPIIETELDTSALTIQTTIGGHERQYGTTSDMRMNVAELVEFVSKVCTLLPGDVISTGSPAGLGTLTDGVTVSVTISGIGTLTNVVKER